MTWELGKKGPQQHDPPLLFNLEQDPSEKYNVADKHPEAIAKIKQAIDTHRAGVKEVPSQLEARIEKTE